MLKVWFLKHPLFWGFQNSLVHSKKICQLLSALRLLSLTTVFAWVFISTKSKFESSRFPWGITTVVTSSKTEWAGWTEKQGSRSDRLASEVGQTFDLQVGPHGWKTGALDLFSFFLSLFIYPFCWWVTEQCRPKNGGGKESLWLQCDRLFILFRT